MASATQTRIGTLMWVFLFVDVLPVDVCFALGLRQLGNASLDIEKHGVGFLDTLMRNEILMSHMRFLITEFLNNCPHVPVSHVGFDVKCGPRSNYFSRESLGITCGKHRSECVDKSRITAGCEFTVYSWQCDVCNQTSIGEITSIFSTLCKLPDCRFQNHLNAKTAR